MGKLLSLTTSGLVVAVLMLFTSVVMAGGGTWKMGPFGPYWDDNSWPEFTPMYWMEEFLNRLNDDDAEIQQWMMRNQYTGGYPGQYPVPPGNNGMSSPWSAPLTQNYYGWQPNAWPNPMMAPPMSVPSASAPVMTQEEASRNHPMARSAPVHPQNPMPVESRPSQSMPRQGAQRQRAPYPPTAYPDFAHLPNLTPQAFSSMPPQLQQQYEQAFNQAFESYQRRQQIERALKRRPPVYDRPGSGAMPQNYPRY